MSDQSTQFPDIAEEKVEISPKSIMSEMIHPAGGNGGLSQTTIGMLMDVALQLSVVLGRTRLSVRQVLDLQKGSVVELDRMAGDVVDIYVNDHLIAQGEVVVVDDKFGVRVTQLISTDQEPGGN
jgi:flagellar motor switch protein FliN/FliY